MSHNVHVNINFNIWMQIGTQDILDGRAFYNDEAMYALIFFGITNEILCIIIL